MIFRGQIASIRLSAYIELILRYHFRTFWCWRWTGNLAQELFSGNRTNQEMLRDVLKMLCKDSNKIFIRFGGWLNWYRGFRTGFTCMRPHCVWWPAPHRGRHSSCWRGQPHTLAARMPNVALVLSVARKEMPLVEKESRRWPWWWPVGIFQRKWWPHQEKDQECWPKQLAC